MKCSCTIFQGIQKMDKVQSRKKIKLHSLEHECEFVNDYLVKR